MSTKVALNSSIKLNSDEWKTMGPCLAAGVKLAGDESKDRLYEPKHKKKLVRVLTVIAYVFFVSLAAIMLSLYYVFLWKGNQKSDVSKSRQTYEAQHSNGGLCSNSDNVLVDVPYEPTAIPVVEAKTEALPSTPDTLILDGDDNMQDTEWSMSVNNTYTHLSEIAKRSPILKKLISNSIVD